MNVLSLFDGLSGGRVALKRAKISVNNYYSSEVDKYAISIADKNHPQDTQNRLGDVTKLTKKQLKKLNINLLIGGSPCQGFSMAGKLKGSSTKDGVEVTTLKQYKKLKKKGFEFEGQSYLFWEFIRVWEIVKPKYFMLENVRVTKKWLPMFNKALGVEPIFINSNLVSGQNRPRYYWTNIPMKKMPKDKGILIKDILDNDVVIIERELPTTTTIDSESDIKSVTKGSSGKSWFFEQQTTTTDSKSRTLKAGGGSGNIPKIIIDKTVRPAVAKNMIEQHDNIVKSDKDFYQMECTSGFQDNKVALKKSCCLRAGNADCFVLDKSILKYRRFTPLECERLQTLPDNYTDGVSTTQRYKMIGNGWTINAVKHIFKGMK